MSAALFLAVLCLPRPSLAADGAKRHMPKTDCLQRWTLSQSGSVLAEQRRAGPPMNDFPTAFAAAKIDPETFLPLEATRDFRVDGRAVLWLTPDRKAVVIDERDFSPLEVADPTRMRAGETKTIGVINAAARAQLNGRSLLEFLLKSGAIRSFWHIEAELCLVSERSKGKGYKARLSGKHVYFTNTEHEGHYAFELSAAPVGAISIVSLP